MQRRRDPLGPQDPVSGTPRYRPAVAPSSPIPGISQRLEGPHVVRPIRGKRLRRPKIVKNRSQGAITHDGRHRLYMLRIPTRSLLPPKKLDAIIPYDAAALA